MEEAVEWEPGVRNGDVLGGAEGGSESVAIANFNGTKWFEDEHVTLELSQKF